MVFRKKFLANIDFISWQALALSSLAACIVFEVIRYVFPIGGETGLLYLFFPSSLMVLSLLVYTRHYLQYSEIKFIFAFFAWMCLTVIINHSRAHLIESYTWFNSLCVTTFLCFSFPYAYEKEASSRAFMIISITMILSVTFLSALGLLAVLFPRIIKSAPTLFSGFGIFESRLWLDNHPNRSAPFCAISVALAFISYIQIKNKFKRALILLCGVICFCALALTDSRTAIIGLSAAIGLVIFLFFNIKLKKLNKLSRLVLCCIFACFAFFSSYKSAVLVKHGYNTISLYITSNKLASIEESGSDLQNTENSGSYNPENNEVSIVEPSAVAASRDLSDIGTFNGRTGIWKGVMNGLMDNPKILLFGTGPAVASEVMSPYFPVGSPVGIFHNSLIGTLVSFGVLGLLFALVFFVIIAGAAIKLALRDLTNGESLGARMVPALLLLTVTESLMEDFLFANNGLNVTWIWFMISAGFVFRYLKADQFMNH